MNNENAPRWTATTTAPTTRKEGAAIYRQCRALFVKVCGPARGYTDATFDRLVSGEVVREESVVIIDGTEHVFDNAVPFTEWVAAAEYVCGWHCDAVDFWKGCEAGTLDDSGHIRMA